MRALNRYLAEIILSVTSIIVFYWFLPEIQLASLSYNDAILHKAVLRRMDEVWSRGGNILDFWIATVNLGHAFLRSYQFLSYFVIWVAHKTVFAWMPLDQCYNACVTVAAMALPWTYFKGALLLGLSRAQAIVAGVAIVLIHEAEGYGAGLTNFTFSGYGTYTQLFSLVTFPLCVGYAYQMARTGKHVVAASLAFAVTFMSHILMGYFAALWIGIDLLCARRFPLKSLLKFSGLVLLWTAHWLVPMIQDNSLQHRSDYEAAFKWVGLGAEKILGDFASGRILDADRLPLMTWLAAAGIVFSFLRHRHLAVQAVAWLALSCGPYTWGAVLKALPFSGTVHWHRAFALAEIALTFCLAAAVGAFFTWVANAAKDERQMRLNLGALVILALALLWPALAERQKYFHFTNTYWLRDTNSHWNEHRTGFHDLLKLATDRTDARFNAGTSSTWGNKILVTSYIPFYGLLSQFNIENIGSVYSHQSHSEVVAFKADWQNPKHNALLNQRYLVVDPQTPVPSNFIKVTTGPTFALYDTNETGGYFAVGADHKGGCADNDGLIRSVDLFLSSSHLDYDIYPEIKLAKNCDGVAKEDLLEMAVFQKISADKTLKGAVLQSGRERAQHSDRHWAKVTMNEPGVVVFKMNYHPNWRATVDGKPVKTHMVLPAYNAARVERGEHRIEFEYVPDAFKRALLWLSVFAWAAFIALAAIRKQRTA